MSRSWRGSQSGFPLLTPNVPFPEGFVRQSGIQVFRLYSRPSPVTESQWRSVMVRVSPSHPYNAGTPAGRQHISFRVSHRVHARLTPAVLPSTDLATVWTKAAATVPKLEPLWLHVRALTPCHPVVKKWTRTNPLLGHHTATVVYLSLPFGARTHAAMLTPSASERPSTQDDLRTAL